MYINNDECPIKGNNSSTDYRNNKSVEPKKSDLFPQDLFFLQCVEKLSEKQKKDVNSISQVFLDILGIKLQTRSTLKKELVKATGSVSLTKALLHQEKIRSCLTKRKAIKVKKALAQAWSRVCLSNLQLLNFAKMCIVEDSTNENSCTFVESKDLKLDAFLLCNLYCARGLKLEPAFLREILPCLPLDGTENTIYILEHQDIVWSHLAATILQNFPVKNGECRELSLQELVEAVVATVKGLGSSFTPTQKFKNFALANKENKSFIANSPASYVSSLYSFYKENLMENDLWWLCLDEETEAGLTTSEQYLVFDCIKA